MNEAAGKLKITQTRSQKSKNIQSVLGPQKVNLLPRRFIHARALLGTEHTSGDTFIPTMAGEGGWWVRGEDEEVRNGGGELVEGGRGMGALHISYLALLFIFFFFLSFLALLFLGPALPSLLPPWPFLIIFLLLSSFLSSFSRLPLYYFSSFILCPHD